VTTALNNPSVARPGSLLRRSGSVASTVLPPVLFGVVVVLLWEGLVKWRNLEPIVLPAPSAIWSAMTKYPGDISSAAVNTGTNALVGLIVGAVLALIAAAIAARLRFVDELITPLAAALATTPIVVLAPLLNFMFNTTSTVPRRLVVVVSVFVPVFVNTVRGLKRMSPVHAELMASLAASGADTLRTIRIPGALPYFFTGVRIAASLAVISAVVAEYFGGLQQGLGPKINSAVAASDTALAWAYVFGAVALGLVFYIAAAFIEWLAMRSRSMIAN
jgi:NitT/TauT family transport system permease protein